MTWAKYEVLLTKANKWEDEAIDKEEKLSKAIVELNDNSRCFVELEKSKRKAKAKFIEAQRKAKVEVEA